MRRWENENQNFRKGLNQMSLTKEKLLEFLNEKCLRHFGCYLKEATQQQIYKSVCLVIRDILSQKRKDFADKCEKQEAKQVYYMSMEFLVGTSLRNNLYNLGMEKVFADALKTLDIDLKDLYPIGPDAGLGNGGLGRLASCYMDSMTSMSIPAMGFSIRYEFGIFKQKIIDGWQMEFPDNWLELGDVWIIPRNDEAFEVRFGGQVTESFEDGRYKAIHHDYDSVIAVPYDMLISGHDTNAVNELVLWGAKSPDSLDMTAFSRGDYMKALEKNTMAEAITKVLYPADDHIDGKRLRLKQQYLLVSASLQSIIQSHLEKYDSLDNFADKVAIHINDTHPALCVPELMRILLDDYHYSWEDAWKITQNTLAYTNHTVMSEALERWPEFLFRELLPRVYQIVCEINRRLYEQLEQAYPGDFAKMEYMAIIANNEIRMANLCLACVHKVNGVSQLHSDILTNSIFRDYYQIMPEKFTNVTNGIAYRRWLCQANPGLTKLLQKLIGNDFIKDANALEKLMKYYDDETVLESLRKVKYDNKLRLCDYIAKTNGINVDPNSIFDVQIKRLHEYKRQLLNVLQILYMYNQIKTNPNTKMPPRTFIFAAKASAGYFMAKQVIRLIHAVSNLVNNDPVAREFIKVVFIEDYKVSLAEIIIPAANISEQISIAGKEASGTGNMKLMINGAVTVGTLDGANVEIHQQVGDDNIFLFGMTSEEVEALWQKGYQPLKFYNSNHDLRVVLDMLTSGVLGSKFREISQSLLTNQFGVADAYMTLADFASYVDIQKKISETYVDKRKFTNMSLVNIAKAGLFSSDRAIKEYSEQIWNAKPVK